MPSKKSKTLAEAKTRKAAQLGSATARLILSELTRAGVRLAASQKGKAAFKALSTAQGRDLLAGLACRPAAAVAPAGVPAAVAEPRILPLRWPATLVAGPAQFAPGIRPDVAAFKAEMRQRLTPGRVRTGAVALAAGPLRPLPPGIVGVGFGAKIVDGSAVATECVRVYVTHKVPRGELTRAQIVPATINGLPTDVVEAPHIVAQAVPCGVSVGHFEVTAGTLGCLVGKAGRTFILSNNHVLANCNAAAAGDEIWQPGAIDGGQAPAIAHLSEFEPLVFGGAPNSIDAAIAELAAPDAVSPEIRMIGRLNPVPTGAATGLAVKKSGRTTYLTSGHVEGISEDVKVEYDGFGSAEFEDQIAVRGASGVFSGAGDSGALIVTADGNQPVALLFAGDESKGLSFGSGIAGILGRFGLSVVT